MKLRCALFATPEFVTRRCDARRDDGRWILGGKSLDDISRLLEKYGFEPVGVGSVYEI